MNWSPYLLVTLFNIFHLINLFKCIQSRAKKISDWPKYTNQLIKKKVGGEKRNNNWKKGNYFKKQTTYTASKYKV